MKTISKRPIHTTWGLGFGSQKLKDLGLQARGVLTVVGGLKQLLFLARNSFLGGSTEVYYALGALFIHIFLCSLT